MEGHADYDTDNFSEGLLECTVDRPQKELDGTKDAYISYLVSTRVILTNI
jgi:sorting nexin-4